MDDEQWRTEYSHKDQTPKQRNGLRKSGSVSTKSSVDTVSEEFIRQIVLETIAENESYKSTRYASATLHGITFLASKYQRFTWFHR